MSKCQTCKHYRYHAGVARSLSKALGKDMPTRPTNYCNYSGFAWERKEADVKKPRGMKCDYQIKEMHCDRCGKLLSKHSDAWMVLTDKIYICQKCGKSIE